MEAVINNTKLIRRVNIFALLILAVCVCAVAFLCKNMWLHICLHRRTVSCDDNIRVLGKGTEILSSFPH